MVYLKDTESGVAQASTTPGKQRTIFIMYILIYISWYFNKLYHGIYNYKAIFYG